MPLRGKPLVRVQPRSNTLFVSQGRSALSTSLDGFIHKGSPNGFFVYETRLLSEYLFKVNGHLPKTVALSNVEQHSWLGYYTAAELDIYKNLKTDQGSGRVLPESERTLEIRVSRYVGDGIHEDIDLTNFTQETLRFEFSIEADADFADQLEVGGERIQFGEIQRTWHDEDDSSELQFHYKATHQYSHQDFDGESEINRALKLRFYNTTAASYDGRSVKFQIELRPLEKWHACVDHVPIIDDYPLEPRYRCHSFGSIRTLYDRQRERFLRESVGFSAGTRQGDLTEVVVSSMNQARHDLATMRLHDLDTGPDGWTMAAGLPTYLTLYGRDTLTASWQSAILGPEMMTGTLEILARTQGRKNRDWFDEQPGRMVHEVHTGPLSALGYVPLSRNYGSITTSHLYPFMVSELWHWTGDKDLILRFVKPALRAIEWTNKHSDSDGDGFFEYQTRSTNGVRHQGWKDSAMAIVDHEGRQVDPPVAISEEQAYVYVSKLHFAETLWWLGLKDEAKRLAREARELKKRFNDKFWCEDIGYYAMGLDAKKQPIRSIGSDAGHCLVAGIADDSLAKRTAERMLWDDLFSGWGIRTLSSENPAFNPYSYHRGSVWPVENATFAVGFARLGLHKQLETLSRSFFEAASLFDFYRLPELFAGHQRDIDHPFPAIYTKSNSPQAWSASATFLMVQAILGLYPYAPLNILFVDPHLPPWLPQFELHHLRVGRARVSLRFERLKDGTTDYSVLSQTGTLYIIRQPSPWSLTASIGERVRDGLSSLFH